LIEAGWTLEEWMRRDTREQAFFVNAWAELTSED
jgi:hypothetical protein